MKNITLKLFSLVVALLLFFYVRSQSNTTQLVLIIPVEISNLPNEKVVLLPSLRQAQVTIRGPSFLVTGVARTPPSFKAVLPPDVPNRYDVPLNSEALNLPPSVEVVQIEPALMQLIFDNKVTKAVPVEVPRIGTINSNFKLLEMKVTPEMLNVVGAETEVREIRNVQTYPIDLRDVDADATERLTVRVPWKYTRPEVKEVTVEVRVASLSVEKKFPKLPIEIRSRGVRALSVIPSVVDVEISGPRSVLNGMKAENLTAYVQIDADVEDTSSISVLLDLPPEVSVVIIEPEKVQVAALPTPTPSTPDELIEN